MIGVEVGHVDFQQVQIVINGIDKANLPGQQMHGADAAIDHAAVAFGDFVMNVTCAELGLGRNRIACFVQAALDSALVFVEPARENGIHLKSFCDEGSWGGCYFFKHRKSPEDFKLFHFSVRKYQRPSLV